MKKSLTIYISKNDNGWLKELRKYAKNNHWSVSLAIRELLSKYFEVNPVYPDQNAAIGDEIIKVKNQDIISTTEKLSPDTYFAQIESKLAKIDNKQIAECIKEMTNSKGEINCYFFNNAREKHSFCKQYCWTRKDIWGKRVRL